jgi:hypothetical protein
MIQAYPNCTQSESLLVNYDQICEIAKNFGMHDNTINLNMNYQRKRNVIN